MIVIFPFVRAPATRYVPASILSAGIVKVVPINSFTPSILILSVPAPEIIAPSGIKFNRPDSPSIEIIEVQIFDSDGISNARAQLGVFAPLGSDGGWTIMYDDGTNGDRVANDGNFTVEISLRSSTPIGTHDVLIQAADQYDVISGTMLMSITIDDDSTVVPGLDETSLSTGLLAGVFGILVIAIIVVSAMLIRNKDDDGSGGDRFGFE